ncbi:hypothetical protein C8A05DRAFT_37845, partial [Staphylotrichum tortipilum]
MGSQSATRSGIQTPKTTRRRIRVPLSCDPCRARKLKCNRELPCQNCTARDGQAACKFRKHEAIVEAAVHNRTNGTGDAMRDRIDHLEDMVAALIAAREQGHSPWKHQLATPESPRSETEPSQPRTAQVNGAHTLHLAADDWRSILDEIRELRNIWVLEEEDGNQADIDEVPSHLVDGSSLLFNQVTPIERIEILSTLPPKPEIDRLVAHFFDRQAFPINVPPILHEPTFLREYDEHWQDPSQANLIWLGLLFSMLGITMLAFHQHGGPPEYEGRSEQLFHLYRMRTAQCLLSGDVAKCQPYTVETLRFNATAELNRKDDNHRGLWIMTGVIIRTAINMGYHRDPAGCAGISVLQAEYRRRVWLAVTSMDDLTSFVGGFPRTTSSLFSDTLEPRNLHPWELSDFTTVLPPSRPLTEPTPVTYLIVKGRLSRALGRIAELTTAPGPTAYSTVLEIDHTLTTIYESFPPHLKVSPDATPTTSSFHAFTLSMLYHKALLLLHRRYLLPLRTTTTTPGDARLLLSRDRCVASALALLTFQALLPVPSFYKMAQLRRMLTLAAMVLFLELELRRKFPGTEGGVDADGVLVQALRGA